MGYFKTDLFKQICLRCTIRHEKLAGSNLMNLVYKSRLNRYIELPFVFDLKLLQLHITGVTLL